MKNIFKILLFMMLPAVTLSQKGKPTTIDSVLLENNTLYQFINGLKQPRGSITGGGSDQSLVYDPTWGSYFSVASGTQRTGWGRWNVVIGENAGDNITSDANYNTLFGKNAGLSITTGDDNVFMGWDAGLFTTSGRGNVGFPQDALKYNTIGSDNIAIGKFAQYTNTRGQGNVSVGFNTFYYLEQGEENVAIGKYAGGILYRGSGNVFIGRYAGEANQSEENKFLVDNAIAIGSYTGLSKVFSNSISIGNNIQAEAANKINIGNVYKGDVATGVAEVNSISISGRQVTFDDNYMYVQTSAGQKRVPLQEVTGTTKAVTYQSSNQRTPIYGIDGKLIGWAIFQLNQNIH